MTPSLFIYFYFSLNFFSFTFSDFKLYIILLSATHDQIYVIKFGQQKLHVVLFVH